MSKLLGIRMPTHLVGLGVVVAVVTTACGGAAATHQARPAFTHLDYGSPADPSATPLQKLQRSLGYPGMRGMVLGRILDDGASTMQDGQVRTAYKFAVESVFASAHATVTNGDTVSVEVPGGVDSQGNPVVVEGAPEFAKGQEYYLWLQDQPRTGLAGGSRAGVIPVPNVANVAAVGGPLVRWLGSNFERSTFEKELRAHPAHS